MRSLLLIFLLSMNVVFAEETQSEPERLSCSVSHVEASRLYDYVNSLYGSTMAPQIRTQHGLRDEGEDHQMFVSHEVSFENFNLSLLAVEKIKMNVYIGDYPVTSSNMNFTIRRGPQFMAIRDSINAGLVPGTAEEDTDYTPIFNLSRKQFVNLVVYPRCRNNGKYFMSKVYVQDTGRDPSDTSDIYPQGGLGNIFGLLGAAFSQ